MEDRIIEFVRAMRAAGVRISVAEGLDAGRALESAGINDRAIVRAALSATLVKEYRDQETFNEMFPQYFGFDQPPAMEQPGSGMSQEDREKLEQILQQMLANMSSEQLRQLFESMMTGEGMSRRDVRELLEMLAQQQGQGQPSQNIPGPWAARKALRQVEFEKLEELLKELLERLREEGVEAQQVEQVEQQAQQNRAQLGQQVAEEAAAGARRSMDDEQRERPSLEDLLDQPIEQLEYTEPDDLRRIIARLAAQIRTRASLRQKRATRGALDAKRTIRANMRYGAIPMELQHRTRRQKPKLTIICDVSGSMRPVSSFMLQLVYALQDQISRTRPFVYYRTLADVASDFNELRPEEAVSIVPTRVQGGPYQTHLGGALRTLAGEHLDAIDRRTTVIFLGDGDDHLGPPNTSDFQQLKRRARRILWLNPEHPYRWEREDNHMYVYGPMCDAVHHVGNLRQLVAAVDNLFG